MAVERFALVAVAVGICALAAPAVAPQLLGAVLAPSPDTAPSSDRHTAQTAQVASPPSALSLGQTVVIAASARGQFETDATINGRIIPVMVDTGATAVAISADAARRLGVVPAMADFRIPVTTANGTVNAAPIMLDEVRVGRITVRDVQAIVVPGNALGGQSLLGMTFLSRLGSFAMADGKLTLRQ
jgi:aspartyl protease family protein